jgi:phosphonate metabolism transcriptional regulator PhnF
MIDKENGIPYYRQLMQIIQQQVASGCLKEGQQLPSALEFGSTYRVNRHTVRQAEDELCRMGVLYKVRGRGTYVSRRPPDLMEYRLSARNRFTENIVEAGRMPGSKILQATEMAAPVEVAEVLKLAATERVYLLEILRLVNDQPFMLSTNYLPVRHLPGFLTHLEHFSSLFAVYNHHYGFIPQRVKASFQATFPQQEDAQLLRIPANVPVLRVYSLLKSRDDLLIQYTIGCYRADLAKISVEWQDSGEGRCDQAGKKADCMDDQSLLAEGL